MSGQKRPSIHACALRKKKEHQVLRLFPHNGASSKGSFRIQISTPTDYLIYPFISVLSFFITFGSDLFIHSTCVSFHAGNRSESEVNKNRGEGRCMRFHAYKGFVIRDDDSEMTPHRPGFFSLLHFSTYADALVRSTVTSLVQFTDSHFSSSAISAYAK